LVRTASWSPDARKNGNSFGNADYIISSLGIKPDINSGSRNLCWNVTVKYFLKEGAILRRCQYLDCIVSNGRMFDKWWFWNDLEGSNHGPIQVLFRNLSGGLKKTMKTSVRLSGVPAEIRTWRLRIRV
jgi:hypothetical protein